MIVLFSYMWTDVLFERNDEGVLQIINFKFFAFYKKKKKRFKCIYLFYNAMIDKNRK